MNDKTAMKRAEAIGRSTTIGQRGDDHRSGAGPPKGAPTSILVVEDDTVDVRHIQRLVLRELKISADVSVASTLQEAQRYLTNQRPDLILLDLGLPDSNGLGTLDAIVASRPETPVIVLTRSQDHELAIEAVARGAQDFLTKGSFAAQDLRRVILFAMRRHETVVRLHEASQELHASALGYQNLVENNLDGILIIDDHGVVRYANPAAERLFGKPGSALIGTALDTKPHDRMELDILSANGERPEVELRVVATEWAGEPAHLVSMRDITDRKRTEKQAQVLRRIALDVGTASSLKEGLERAQRLLADVLGFPISSSWIVGRQGRHVQRGPVLNTTNDEAASNHASQRHITRAKRSLVQSALESGEPAWHANLHESRYEPRIATFVRAGIRTALVVPIQAADATYVLEFFCTTQRPEDPSLMAIVKPVATQIGALLRQKEAEDALRSSEERFRSLTDAATDAIVSVDQKNRIIYVNAATEAMFRYPRSDLVGRSFHTLIPNFLGAEVGADRAHAAQQGNHRLQPTFQTHARRHYGRTFPVELSSGVWETPDGTYRTWIIRDITERRRVDDALADRAKDLETFAYAVTHDLKSPLATLDWILTELEDKLGMDGKALRSVAVDGDEVDPDHVSDLMKRLRTTSEFMADLVEDLLALCQVDHGDTKRDPVELPQLFHDIQARHHKETSRRGIALVGDFDAFALVRGDAVRIRQLLENLVSNAIKHGQHEGGTIDVRTRRIQRDGKQVFRIEVEDEGPGVPLEGRERVFELFERMPDVEGRNIAGTGVGLALATRVARHMRGRLGVEDGDKGGARFFLEPTCQMLDPMQGRFQVVAHDVGEIIELLVAMLEFLVLGTEPLVQGDDAFVGVFQVAVEFLRMRGTQFEFALHLAQFAERGSSGLGVATVFAFDALDGLVDLSFPAGHGGAA